MSELARLLDTHSDKRVVVLGTTCVGKSTIVKQMDDAEDMDKLVFPLLSEEERAYVCREPWTPEIGETMSWLVKERVEVIAGKPLFGTVVLDADLIILLDISDELLQERTAKRGVTFEDAKNMQKQIIDSAQTSGIPILYYDVT